MNPWRLSILLALLVTVISLLQDRPQAFQTSELYFLDGDDTMRLQQVRGLLNGEGWFNPVIRSIGDGAGLASHWSRLVDAPIALLILLGRLFMSQAAAEHVALLAWPKLVLVMFLSVLFRELLRERGLQAVGAFSIIIALSSMGFMQFQLLRIDHHNVQIACALLSLVLATSPYGSPKKAMIAGAIGGLGLVIGYEALPIIGIAAGMLALAALWDRARHDIAVCFAGGLALAVSTAFVATVRPQEWLPVPCDTLGLNVVLAASTGSLGLLVAGFVRNNVKAYATALAVTALVAAGMLLRLEPVCAGGPFARFDPAMGELWLRHVREARSLWDIGREMPELCLAIAITILIGCGLQLWAFRRDASPEQLMRLVICLVLTVLGFRYLKMISYAQLFTYACAALAITTLPRLGPSVSPAITKAFAILLMSTTFQTLLTPLVIPESARKEADNKPNLCYLERNFAGLKELPSARILAQQDMGGFLALLSQHHVMAGNYHRLDAEIMRTAAIFRAPVEGAQQMLDDWKIDLVVHCAGRDFYRGVKDPGSLADLLYRETPPAYLTPIPLVEGSQVRAFRVNRN